MKSQIPSLLCTNTPPLSVLATIPEEDLAEDLAKPGKEHNLTTCFSGLSVKSTPPSATSSGSPATVVTSVMPEALENSATDLKKREVKTDFVPFQSIESWQNKPYINRMFRYDPGLNDALYVGSEKLDGANFTVIIDSKSIRYYSRHREVTANKPFFDAPMTFKQYKEDFKKIQSALGIMECQSFSLRGEYFGSGINRRIDYGPKQFAPFIIEKNGKTQTHQQFRAFMNDMQFSALKPVPLLFSGVSFEEALAFDPSGVVTRARTDTEGQTTQATASDTSTVHDFIEGVVIQPCDFLIKRGQYPFLLKKRADQYLEIEHKGTRLCKPGNKHTQPDNPDIKVETHSFPDFLNYVTENRVINVISQYGVPSSRDSVGFYIQATIDDAKKDYCKDYADAAQEDPLPKSLNKTAKSKIIAILREQCPELFQKKNT